MHEILRRKLQKSKGCKVAWVNTHRVISIVVVVIHLPFNIAIQYQILEIENMLYIVLFSTKDCEWKLTIGTTMKSYMKEEVANACRGYEAPIDLHKRFCKSKCWVRHTSHITITNCAWLCLLLADLITNLENPIVIDKTDIDLCAELESANIFLCLAVWELQGDPHETR